MCLNSVISNYRLEKSISDFEIAKKEFNEYKDSSFKVAILKSENLRRQRERYISKMLLKNKENLVIHLDSIKLNIIPDTVFRLPSVETLKIISSNNDGAFELKEITSKIWRLKKVETLDFSGNRITKISSAISTLGNLRTLNIKGHQLTNEDLENLKETLHNECKLIY